MSTTFTSARGSPYVAMHGQLNSALCAHCGEQAPWQGDMPPGSVCRTCNAPALRPDIVFFGEIPYDMDRIETALSQADLFVSIGTSGAVYPAAGFVRMARPMARRPWSSISSYRKAAAGFDECRHGPASTLVPAWVDELLA